MTAGAILDLNWEKTVDGKVVVGWPQGTMYKRVIADCAEYRAAGFTALLYPPVTLGAGGVYSDGYDSFNPYVLDGTAYGFKADLIASIKAAHAQGLQIGIDLVLHQADGGANQIYETPPWSKDPTCFAKVLGQKEYPGNVEPDSVPDASGGWPDGDLCAYDQPNRRMWNAAIAWVAWLKETIDFDFVRIDEAKDLHAPFVVDLLNSPALKDCFAGAEYFDGSNAALGGYVNYWTNRRVSVFDYGFKFNVQTICNNSSKAWMGALASIGYVAVDPLASITMLEDHDTDNSPGEQIIWNKGLGVGIQMTIPGYPSVYYRDWSDDPDCYNLKALYANGLWIHANLAQGDFVVRLDTNPQVFAMERMGFGNAPGCVCAFNNDQYSEHTVTIQTRYAPGIRLHEYSGLGGYSNDRWTDGSGRITITLPKNNNGLSYLVYGVYL